ncbi:MAG: hypothetical protein NVS9B7_10640 [Flavisolibacter sp.]
MACPFELKDTLQEKLMCFRGHIKVELGGLYAFFYLSPFTNKPIDFSLKMRISLIKKMGREDGRTDEKKMLLFTG